jgi:hypothetical protein
MTDKIKEQIEIVRKSGAANMLDTIAVQRYAHDNHLYDLVLFIEEDRKKYARFIMTGKTEP